MKTTYYATTEGPIAGLYRKVGDPVVMTPKEAKYLEMSGGISKVNPISAKPAPAPEAAPANAGKDGKKDK